MRIQIAHFFDPHPAHFACWGIDSRHASTLFLSPFHALRRLTILASLLDGNEEVEFFLIESVMRGR